MQSPKPQRSLCSACGREGASIISSSVVDLLLHWEPGDMQRCLSPLGGPAQGHTYPTTSSGIGKVRGMRLNLRSPQLSIVCIYFHTLIHKILHCGVCRIGVVVTGRSPRPDPDALSSSLGLGMKQRTRSLRQHDIRYVRITKLNLLHRVSYNSTSRSHLLVVLLKFDKRLEQYMLEQYMQAAFGFVIESKYPTRRYGPGRQEKMARRC